MKYFILAILTVSTLSLASCNDSNGKNLESNAHSKVDSCNIALKFENAEIAESMVDPHYSGDLNNYWGDDSTKLDFKHVFKNGKLLNSYFYYENQTIQEAYSFKCGALHGQQKWFHENGKLAKVIPYRYGYRNGTGALYDENGQLMQKITFRNDSIIGEVEHFDRSTKVTGN